MFDPVEKLKEFVRHESVSTDPTYAAGMVGAKEFVANLLGSIGFEVEVVKTDLHPLILARRRLIVASRDYIRPLRRAAGRSTRIVGHASI